MMGMGAPAVVVDLAINEEAAAVGDPHMVLTSGESDDLCCESGVCKPCPVALLQEESFYYSYYAEINAALVLLGEDELGMGMGMMGMGMMGMGNMGMMGMGNAVVNAAVGDPHMTLTSGESDDLCCESGVCKPCPVALLQEE